MAGENQLQLDDLRAALPEALQGLGQADLVNVLQERMNQMIGLSSGYLESLPKKVQNRIRALQALQDEHDELEEKFLQERAELEAKYQKMYEPLYGKRAEIVTGVVEPEYIAAAVEEEEEGAEEEKAAAEKKPEEKDVEEDVVGVPHFWLTALRNNDVLEEQITDRDEEALRFLKDVRWASLDGRKGFKLDFVFAPNPFFSNEVLTKTYLMVDEEEPILDKAIGTEINWQPGKNLCVKVLKKKPKKGSVSTTPVTKTERIPSFFNFFSPPEVPEGDEIDEDEAEQLQEHMESDYDVGSTLKEKIIPHAVKWFTGEVENFEDDYEGGHDDDDDEDDEEGEELDDEEEDDEDADDEEGDGAGQKDEKHGHGRGRARGRPAARGAKTAAAGAKGGDPTGEPEDDATDKPECKQQ